MATNDGATTATALSNGNDLASGAADIVPNLSSPAQVDSTEVGHFPFVDAGALVEEVKFYVEDTDPMEGVSGTLNTFNYALDEETSTSKPRFGCASSQPLSSEKATSSTNSPKRRIMVMAEKQQEVTIDVEVDFNQGFVETPSPTTVHKVARRPFANSDVFLNFLQEQDRPPSSIYIDRVRLNHQTLKTL